MRFPNLRWMAASLAWALVALGGCGNNEDIINQVQPNAVSKAMLANSEWYVNSTVIDTDYHSTSFVGLAGTMHRIEWDIQEEHLIGRRSYEYQRGSEGPATSGEDSPNGRIVVMFDIESHFDIRRAYNPVTGEEQNVLVENATDRPWYEREYFRVDWSRNKIDPDMAMGGVRYDVQIDGENGSQIGWEPKFERDADGDVYYFDLVQKYLTSPTTTRIPADPSNPDGPQMEIPTCMLVTGIARGQDDCAPGEVGMRWSFLRVEDRDYEPQLYTADRMDRFGYFLTHRDGYSRDNGLTRYERRRFVNRHNIWEKSHLRVSLDDSRYEGREDLFRCDGDEQCMVKCANDNDCGGLPSGSYCDIDYGLAHETFGACTIPFRDRVIRPIAYHLSEDFPPEFIEDMKNMADGWDAAFQQTAASLRRIECEQAGAGNCEQYTAENTPDIYVMCHNPVIEGDNAACGAVGTVARIGDLRYKQISWINEPHVSSPLGYGPSQADPFSGELIGARANVYGAPVDVYSSQARDLLAMLQGDLTVEDVQSNSAYLGWIDSVQQRNFEVHAREAEGHVIALDGDDVEDANDSMNFDYYKARMPAQAPATVETFAAQFERAQKAAQLIGENDAFGRKARSRVEALQGTFIEDLMNDSERRYGAGFTPDMAATDADIDSVSPFRSGGLRGMKYMNWARKQLDTAHQHCILRADFADDGLLGLVREIDRAVTSGDGTVEWYGIKYPVGNRETGINYDMVREMVRHPIFHAVMQHEVGHTLGLRHNFSGSFDAVNYKQRYWELRAADGTIEPRAWDPLSEAEIDGRITEYQYSTTMEYGNNFVVTDAHGVGHWDIAAIKMGYGDLAEVFTDAPAANANTIAQLNATVTAGVLYNLDPASTTSIGTVKYTEWPNLVGGVENLDKRKDVPYMSLQVVQNPLLGGGARSITEDGLPAVPYMYCGDEFSNFNPTCLTYDAGADPYETLQSVIDSYWDYYPFSHFQRQRLSFNYEGVKQRSYGRFLTKLESATRIYSLYRVLLGSALGGDAFFEAPDGWGAYTVGVRAAYDLLRRIVTTPEPGSHLPQTEVDGTEVLAQGAAANVFDLGMSYDVDSFDGRFLRTGFDFGPDFTWIFFDRAGWFHDKDVAMQVLMYSDVEFLAQDTTADVREFSTNFYTAFQDSLGPFIGGIITHDWKRYAPRITSDGNLIYPDPSHIQKMGLDMPAGDRVLDPNVAFSLEMVAMAYGMAYIQRAFDQDFVNKSRIWVEGADEAITPDPTTTELISFTDPRSGLVYTAVKYPDADVPGMNGQVLEAGVGAAMVQRAIDLQAQGREAELIDWLDNMDIMRALTGWFGGGASGTLVQGL